MGKPQLKSADPQKNSEEVAARCKQGTDERKKQSFWVIRQSDERIVRTNEAIDRTRNILEIAGKSRRTRKPKTEPEDPFLKWGELLIHGNRNRKRRADD